MSGVEGAEREDYDDGEAGVGLRGRPRNGVSSCLQRDGKVQAKVSLEKITVAEVEYSGN